MDIITALFEIMRKDLYVMSEYADSESALLKELTAATPEILEEYKKIYFE